MVEPALVWGGDKRARGEIIIPLSGPVIAMIEASRNGGDLIFEIDSRVLLSKAVEGPPGLRSVLMAPTEGRFTIGIDSRIKHTIPQSEWIKLLRRLEWSEAELVELPVDLLRSEPRLARARERLRDAETSLARGDWEGVFQNCRKAWEAAARGLTGQKEHQSALPKLRSYFGEGLEAERLNAVALEFGEFLHLGRHEQAGDVKIDRAHAILALRITTALLGFLACV